MTYNAEQFIKFYEEEFGERIKTEEDVEGNISILMTVNKDIESRIMLAFDNDNSMVYIYGSSSKLEIPDESRDEVLRILNKYNSDYAVTKFVCEDNSVWVESFLPFHNNFSAEITLHTLFNIANSITDVYKTLSESGLLN